MLLCTHAIELRDQGYTVLPRAAAEPLIAEARVQVSSHAARLRDMVEELGLNPTEDSYAFAELDKRHRLRWSLQAPPSCNAWTEVVDCAVVQASAVIQTMHMLPENADDASHAWTGWLPTLPAVTHTGAIISGDGAKAQVFHADAGELHLKLSRLSTRHRLFNVFVPLVDVAEGGDGTMLWPRSHLMRTRAVAYHEALGRSARLEDDAAVMSEMVVPGCPAGGVIIFDFRLLHRGQPNRTGRERPMAHAILSTGFAFDQKGTPSSSLRAAVAALPADPAARRRVREGVVKRQKDAWRQLRARSAL